MNKSLRHIGTCAGIFVAGILMFLVLGWLVWLLPQGRIDAHVEESNAILEQEGKEWIYQYTYETGSKLDNWTDSVMILLAQPSKKQDFNAFQNSLWDSGYFRYWQGYLVWLRPLLVVMNYTQIRYLYMFVLMLLVGANVLRIRDRFSPMLSYLFLFTLCLGNLVVLPYSLQFSSVFFVMLIANLVVLCRSWEDDHAAVYFFLAVGMVTNFVDFLTAPLLTLGIPLALMYALRHHTGKTPGKQLFENTLFLLRTSVSWALGFGLTWISKWAIASAMFGPRVMADITKEASFHEEENGLMTKLDGIWMNLRVLTPSLIKESAHVKLILLLLVILLAALLIVFHGRKQQMIADLPLLLLALYPFGWYFVLGTHSNVHFFFTYRTLLVTVFAVAMYCYLSTGVRLRECLHRRK